MLFRCWTTFLGILALCPAFLRHATVSGSNILVYLHPIAVSHSTFALPLADGLKEQNHTVYTMHTPVVSRAEGVKADFEIIDSVREGSKRGFQRALDEYLWSRKLDLMIGYRVMFRAGETTGQVCRYFKDSAWLQRIRELKITNLIIDPIFAPCGHYLSKALQFSFGMTVGLPLPMPHAHRLGLPMPSAYTPLTIHPLGQRMSFVERCLNFVDGAISYLIENTLACHAVVSVKRAVSPVAFLNNQENATYVMVNDDNNLLSPRPLVPSVYFAGGYNIESNGYEKNDIKQELRRFLEMDDRPVIVICMSTMVKASKMPDEFKKTFIETFRRFQNFKFVWRLEDPMRSLDALSNVFAMPWVPFKALLKSGKVASVVIHGGINSIFEAIYYNVPIIGVPLYGDQPSNVKRTAEVGVGVLVMKDDLSVPTLAAAIQTTLSNRMRQRVQKYSIWMRDRPASKLTEAVQLASRAVRYNGLATWTRIQGTRLNGFAYFSLESFAAVITLMVCLWCTVSR